MRRKLFTAAILCLYLIVHMHLTAWCNNTPSKKIVYSFTLDQEIAPPALRLVKRAFKEAEDLKASAIIIQLNTYGGELDVADEIHSLILHSKIPVYVLVEQNAASAGALISISCDSIYMKKGSTIGAASVVNQNGEIMPDKFQSYMRGIMRATAQQRGRDPKIAEGMVTPNGYLKDIADTGRIITMTADEAVRYKYCDCIADDANELLKHAGVNDYKLLSYEPSAMDAIINFLMNPIVNSILLLMIIGGIYFEFQHPGIGIPLFMGIGAAVLYFAPLYLDGLAANWEILLFVIGLILVIIEIFLLPGHLLPGIIGMVMVVAGLTLALVNNHNFNFSFVSWTDLIASFFRVVAIVGLGLVTVFTFGRRFFQSGMLNRAVLTSTMESTNAYIEPTARLTALIQQMGTAVTDLRPAGAVNVKGEQYDAVGEGGYIHRNDEVKVVEVRGNYLVVRKAEN